MSYPSLEELNLVYADLCRALSDPKRILILYALYDEPRHVTGLAAKLELPQPTVSRHLRRLEQQALVCSERVGPTVVYSITNPRIMDLLELMREVRCDALAQQSSVLTSRGN
ncbi:MAG: metalloregulator ArsR/SmtB family transcription factor [Chloroflexota bacterium]|jgi:ArsR family transcriptional regulator